jgi:malonyl-ACP decarboxylase
VLATVAGYDLKLDGNSLADPSEAGEARVMVGALRRAGLEPKDIGYVNAHGTGAPLGDRVEAAALRTVLEPLGHAWVNSTKALAGHCLHAAGVLEAVATILQVRGGFVHPTPGLDRPIDPDLRFVGATAQRAEPGYALSNSFGFGGFNACVAFGPGEG